MKVIKMNKLVNPVYPIEELKRMHDEALTHMKLIDSLLDGMAKGAPAQGWGIMLEQAELFFNESFRVHTEIEEKALFPMLRSFPEGHFGSELMDVIEGESEVGTVAEIMKLISQVRSGKTEPWEREAMVSSARELMDSLEERFAKEDALYSLAADSFTEEQMKSLALAIGCMKDSMASGKGSGRCKAAIAGPRNRDKRDKLYKQCIHSICW